jgi:acetylornithine deacetylase/succinyl-diaminopimelate desuccinylase-like protein
MLVWWLTRLALSRPSPVQASELEASEGLTSYRSSKIFDRKVRDIISTGVSVAKSELDDSDDGRWREPSLSVHKIDVSGPSHSTVIPSKAKAAVSIRIVPDQTAEEIGKALESHLRLAFKQLKSQNSISVN